jgi:Uma2 family endonuclease
MVHGAAITPIVSPKRFSVDDYHRLIDLGFFQEGDRVELVNGELIQMAAKGTPHTFSTTRLCRQCDRVLGDRVVVRCQEPITLAPNSEPEPDVVLAYGDEVDYLAHHPYAQEIALVIEVADSTVVYDQTIKLSLYAAAQIAHYWIVNLPAGQLECYSQPYQTPQTTGYTRTQIFLPTQSVAIPGFVDVVLSLERIFPTK